MFPITQTNTFVVKDETGKVTQRLIKHEHKAQEFAKDLSVTGHQYVVTTEILKESTGKCFTMLDMGRFGITAIDVI